MNIGTHFHSYELFANIGTHKKIGTHEYRQPARSRLVSLGDNEEKARPEDTKSAE